ncbi:MAG: glycosyltransferase [Gammaproteobacteria bacterium]|nr:glycosyltransferase family 4 protein [Pseudomonadales bacterium]MCP5349097.1 glycosyltransferase family 4 protein [Pseudomonadales bacterium]
MRISLYNYITDPLLPQKDGVNLAHENITRLLQDNTSVDLTISFHDFNRLLADENYARRELSGCDYVVSNVGPHAHYYFYLREKLNLSFRILRDVRTAIWSSYLFQEYLCTPYLRETDILMVASHYTRGIYEKLFPALKQGNTFRCYPLAVCFPDELPARSGLAQDKETICLGYIGRLSEDKNFPDLVELLIRLNLENGTTSRERENGESAKSEECGINTKYKLVACGEVHSESCSPTSVEEKIHRALGEGDYFEYMLPRKNRDIWELYRSFDLLIFPSTSNLETFGRVLIEASYAELPVVCGEHAAAAELMPPSSLCGVDYKYNFPFSTHFDHNLGKVNIADMVRAITNGGLSPSSCQREYAAHPEMFLDVLTTPLTEISVHLRKPLSLTASQKAFIDSLRVSMPPPLTMKRADRLIETLTQWFLALQDKRATEYPQLLTELMDNSKHAERTQRFIDKCAVTNSDFTNVGGIDIELCHIADFYPEFYMTPQF